MKIRDKGQRLTIKGLAKETGYSEKEVIYFLIEFSIAITIGYEKWREDGKNYTQEAIYTFLNNKHGRKLSRAAYELWKTGGEAIKDNGI